MQNLTKQPEFPVSLLLCPQKEKDREIWVTLKTHQQTSRQPLKSLIKLILE